MPHTEAKLEALRSAGSIATNLLDMDFPPVAFGCPSDEDGLQFEEDERYWTAVQETKQRMESFGEVEVKTDYRDEPSPFVSLIARRMMDGNTFAQIHLDYAASGDCHLSIEYQIKEGWHIMLDHDFPELDSMEIGRLLARAELAILANELESGTEALDYWVTEVSAHHSESRYSQSDWARVRNVSRQTVNQRVQAVKQRLVG